MDIRKELAVHQINQRVTVGRHRLHADMVGEPQIVDMLRDAGLHKNMLDSKINLLQTPGKGLAILRATAAITGHRLDLRAHTPYQPAPALLHECVYPSYSERLLSHSHRQS